MSQADFGGKDFTSNPNPYQSNTSVLLDQDQSGEVSEVLISMSRWQTFFGILGFLGSAIMMLVVLVQMVQSLAGGNAGGIVGAIVVVAVSILVYIIPCMLLMRAASAARSFAYGNQGSLLELAKTQRGFWRYTGMAVSIILALYLVIGIVAAVVLFGFRQMR